MAEVSPSLNPPNQSELEKLTYQIGRLRREIASYNRTLTGAQESSIESTAAMHARVAEFRDQQYSSAERITDAVGELIRMIERLTAEQARHTGELGDLIAELRDQRFYSTRRSTDIADRPVDSVGPIQSAEQADKERASSPVRHLPLVSVGSLIAAGTAGGIAVSYKLFDPSIGLAIMTFSIVMLVRLCVGLASDVFGKRL
jgi:hypothetical protein